MAWNKRSRWSGRSDHDAWNAHLVGHALGGRAGERLLGRLGMAMGADTIVRLVKRGAPPPDVDETLRVVGIDDWAWQKGQQHFGTILVDLERRRVVDVLAVRTADAVAAWLAAHPGIRIISPTPAAPGPLQGRWPVVRPVRQASRSNPRVRTCCEA